MPTLFDAADRSAILGRLERLQPSSARQWGKMDPAQMLAHCALALEAATGDLPVKQGLIGKLLGPFVRSLATGDKPFGKDSPTDPKFVVADARSFEVEKKRLQGVVDRFVTRGPAEAAKIQHAFFGRLSGDEWGHLMHKHVDHHLRQFGV